MSKAKRQEKQDARAIKLLDSVISGRAKLACYEAKKKPSQSNRKGGATPTDEEADEMVKRYAHLLRVLLPGILAKLSQIEDPRDQRRATHSLPLLILFGILMFLSHSTSRRAANRDLAKQSLLTLVETFLPGIQDMPHADTLARLLCVIDASEIDKRYEELLSEFLHSKQFRELNPGRFLVAIDGTQKFSRRYLWDERTLSRNAGDEGKQRYCVYVLESVLVLENGMVLPLLTEILENSPKNPEGERTPSAPASEERSLDKEQAEVSEETIKQDCETKSFHRLSGRLSKLLGKGCVTVVLDGIYASGPVLSRCKQYGWDYMIVLKQNCLKTVWENFNGLRKIESENTHQAQWGKREQEYHWSNGLEYTYGKNHKRLKLNVVTCTETWIEEHPRSGKKPQKMVTKYAWLSSQRLTSENVFHLCTKIARARWRVENNFLVEKHQGYNYSHCYSYNWNAMKGFHYLMKFGVFLNVLLTHCEALTEYVRIEGVRSFVKKIWELLTQGKWPLIQRTADMGKRQKRMHFPVLRSTA